MCSFSHWPTRHRIGHRAKTECSLRPRSTTKPGYSSTQSTPSCSTTTSRHGTHPEASWRRLPSRPRYTWISQLEQGTGISADQLWNIAADRMERAALRPLAGSRNRWWWWRWRRRRRSGTVKFEDVSLAELIKNTDSDSLRIANLQFSVNFAQFFS